MHESTAIVAALYDNNIVTKILKYNSIVFNFSLHIKMFLLYA